MSPRGRGVREKIEIMKTGHLSEKKDSPYKK
jgi:hypothetical protein